MNLLPQQPHAPRRSQVRAPLVLCTLLAACALAAPASRAAAVAPEATRLVVLPFEFFDASIDQRPQLLRWQQAWLRGMPRQFEQALQRADPGVRVIDTPRVRSDERALAGDYAHPSTCGPCLLRLGRRADADYVLSASVRKVSDLILYLQARVIDPRRGTVAAQYLLEVKADNADMWRRAAQHLARQVAHRLDGLH